jgi:Na+/phosphate symporter
MDIFEKTNGINEERVHIYAEDMQKLLKPFVSKMVNDALIKKDPRMFDEAIGAKTLYENLVKYLCDIKALKAKSNKSQK